LPSEIALRPRVLPDRARSHEIGADLTDPSWLDSIPSDRPAIAVADGLIAFLPSDGLVSMLNGIVRHFPSGELGFNAYTTFTVNAAKRYSGTSSIAAGMVNPGFDDPREPERWAPGLKLAESIYLTRAPEIEGLGWAMRAWYRLAGRSDSLSAKGTTVLHYRF
jgi:O-methyltransferase involved in polyketide biosynthesis